MQVKKQQLEPDMEKWTGSKLEKQCQLRIRLNLLFNFECPLSQKVLSGIWGYSSAGRAPALQAGGQRFDPAYLHHWLKT